MATDEKARTHQVVSREDWLTARRALLAKEKEFTRLRDELSRERRGLPWVRAEKPYVFDSPQGEQSLTELFEGRSQLIVYHFMFSPEATQGCAHCSFWADSFNGIRIHLNNRDTSLIAVSRAPVSRIEPFRKRMGWDFNWVSSGRNSFNYDFNVSFTPEQVKRGAGVYNYTETRVGSDREGVSVFHLRETGDVFHTYSTFARGIDLLNTAYNYLDLVPKGRDEEGLPNTQAWVRHHDRYQG